jgi:hypothetical protein
LSWSVYQFALEEQAVRKRSLLYSS